MHTDLQGRQSSEQKESHQEREQKPTSSKMAPSSSSSYSKSQSSHAQWKAIQVSHQGELKPAKSKSSSFLPITPPNVCQSLAE